MEYKRLTSRDCFGNVEIIDSPIIKALNRLAELEDKIEQGRLVDCIWFISWLNEEVCCGQVIGYEKDCCFVVITNNSMISADKIWTNREEAEKELLKRKIKELDNDEYQELRGKVE